MPPPSVKKLTALPMGTRCRTDRTGRRGSRPGGRKSPCPRRSEQCAAMLMLAADRVQRGADGDRDRARAERRATDLCRDLDRAGTGAGIDRRPDEALAAKDVVGAMNSPPFGPKSEKSMRVPSAAAPPCSSRTAKTTSTACCEPRATDAELCPCLWGPDFVVGVADEARERGARRTRCRAGGPPERPTDDDHGASRDEVGLEDLRDDHGVSGRRRRRSAPSRRSRLRCCSWSA